MRRRCKQHDDCDVICEEKRIAFFHIEEKELLPQDKVTPFATQNKRIKSVGAASDKQHIKRNRLKPYKPPNADFLSAVRLISDCCPLRFCRYLSADHACVQSDVQRHKQKIPVACKHVRLLQAMRASGGSARHARPTARKAPHPKPRVRPSTGKIISAHQHERKNRHRDVHGHSDCALFYHFIFLLSRFDFAEFFLQHHEQCACRNQKRTE